MFDYGWLGRVALPASVHRIQAQQVMFGRARTATFTTSLPDGAYCNIISGTSVSGACTGSGLRACAASPPNLIQFKPGETFLCPRFPRCGSACIMLWYTVHINNEERPQHKWTLILDFAKAVHRFGPRGKGREERGENGGKLDMERN
ncbi:hypothetical protein C8R44DRAFT_744239 [Mycena epipterygia]|nr:hypothetical protein C8R44DRAFT_744239 [Mycena epipterygia]